MRALCLVALLAACDFYVSDDGDSAVGDAGPTGPDARSGETCAGWHLATAEASGLAMMDQEPYEVGRTARVAVSTVLGPCDERAMPQVTIAEADSTITVELQVWRQDGECTNEMEITRPVAFRFPAAGTWTIAADGAEPISVKVDPEPGGQCGTGNECRRDCDCAGQAVCLRGAGLGGDFNSCARPCELDRDCGGNGTCTDVADGLSRVCSEGGECTQDSALPCPDGFSCDVDTDSCVPGFTLNEETRAPCSCDADCASPLRCVRGAPDELRGRCQITCPTGGPWCEGSHVCGAAADDASGLAGTDSVCIWLGE